MKEKPLFIALKTEYFEAFEDGSKTDEMRLYGPRWNERTCRVGRPVTLSKGYGKKYRLSGVIVGFEKKHGNQIVEQSKLEAIFNCYGTLKKDMAIIYIQVDRSKS